MASEAAMEDRRASSAEASLQAADFLRAPPNREIPKTTTIAVNGAGSLAASLASANVVRHDAADRILENARQENERARKALNDLEMQRSMKRAECGERFRIKAEELMAERERELSRIETEFDKQMAAPLALLRVTDRLAGA